MHPVIVDTPVYNINGPWHRSGG